MREIECKRCKNYYYDGDPGDSYEHNNNLCPQA